DVDLDRLRELAVLLFLRAGAEEARGDRAELLRRAVLEVLEQRMVGKLDLLGVGIALRAPSRAAELRRFEETPPQLLHLHGRKRRHEADDLRRHAVARDVRSRDAAEVLSSGEDLERRPLAAAGGIEVADRRLATARLAVGARDVAREARGERERGEERGPRRAHHMISARRRAAGPPSATRASMPRAFASGPSGSMPRSS